MKYYKQTPKFCCVVFPHHKCVYFVLVSPFKYRCCHTYQTTIYIWLVWIALL